MFDGAIANMMTGIFDAIAQIAYLMVSIFCALTIIRETRMPLISLFMCFSGYFKQLKISCDCDVSLFPLTFRASLQALHICRKDGCLTRSLGKAD